LQVGVDVPVTPAISVSPFIGATATMFLTQELAQESSFSNVHSPNVNVFLNAGVLGRFDLLGAPSTKAASSEIDQAVPVSRLGYEPIPGREPIL